MVRNKNGMDSDHWIPLAFSSYYTKPISRKSKVVNIPSFTKLCLKRANTWLCTCPLFSALKHFLQRTFCKQLWTILIFIAKIALFSKHDDQWFKRM